MDQHPVPRQITSFEFKLIGFMTLRQFIYLLGFTPAGIVFFLFFPVPIVKQFIGILIVLVGVAFAFFPINDRPLDVWIKNLVKRLFTATQFTYHKENAPIYFFDSLVFTSDPHQTVAHVESEEKLKAYLAQEAAKNAPAVPPQEKEKKREIGHLFQNIIPKKGARQVALQTVSAPAVVQPIVVASKAGGPLKKPSLVGVIKNNKKIPLPGILVYVRDQTGRPIRLLKSNPHGIFATYNPLSPGEYVFEIKDPKGGFVFDTMKYQVGPQNTVKPLEFYSKELL